MTTIIGISNQNGAVIAGDSKISTIDTAGYASQTNTLPKGMSKVVELGDYIIGASGDLRAINLIQHAFHPTKPPQNAKKLAAHIINKFIPELRQTFDDHGYSTPTKDSGNHVAEHSSTILVAAKGQIFCIDGDYSVMGETSGIYAIGTGCQYALGYLYNHRYQIPHYPLSGLETVAISALNAASHWDPHTGPPNTCHTSPTKKQETNGRK